MTARAEGYEYVFFLAFVVVCALVPPAVDRLHIANPVVNGAALLAGFALALLALEWLKRRAMRGAKSIAVARIVTWTSVGVPVVLFLAGRFAHQSFSESAGLAIYLGVTTLAVGLAPAVLRLARRPAAAQLDGESS